MSRRDQILLICLLLAAAILVAFWHVLDSGFVKLDDNVYVTENGHVRAGLTWEGVRWAFTTGRASNWHPLTWLSHMADVQLFGLAARGHHRTSLVLHIANTLLLFLVLQQMTSALWQSAVVAALFALHPLHVESVAWVAERKDVLSTFFGMLTLAAYVHYVNRPGLQRYLWVLIAFALGLMAKPMLVTLPFVLLLLDYWPLQRQDGIRPLLWEKLPLLVLVAISSIVTFLVQQRGGAVQSLERYSLGVRVENALVSYAAYLRDLLWPTRLAVYYPLPRGWPAWQIGGALILLVVLTALAIASRKRAPYLSSGWFWYLGMLVPVIGLVQVGGQSRADRYTYVPMIGLFMIVAWGIADVSRTWRHRKELLVGMSAVLLLSLGVATRKQVGYWKNSFTLFNHTLSVTANNGFIYNNRGVVYAELGDYAHAIEDHDRAIQLSPSYDLAWNSRGFAYSQLGDHQRAIESYDRAIQLNPRFAQAHNNRGGAYAELGDYRRAVSDYDSAIELEPSSIAYENRGRAHEALGEHDQAMKDLRMAASLGSADARTRLKQLLQSTAGK